MNKHLTISRFAIPLTVAAVLLSGCASSVQRGETSSSSSGTPTAGATPNTSPNASLPAFKIPAASSQKVVLSMQLEPPHTKDSGWQSFKQEWVDITKERATGQRMAFAAQDGDPKPTGEAGTLVVVRVKDYKHVGVAARVMLGIMAGSAFIESKVEYRDLGTGQLWGERTYNTSSSAWQGVFGSATPKQIYALADEILGEMKRQ